MPSVALSPLDVLKKHWGYEQLRPHQEQAIQAILNHKDSMVVLSTGGGKSLCYQLPAMLCEGMAIVVSPLLSLIKDQVDALKANGIPAASLNSMLDISEKRRLRDAIRNQEIKVLYLAPESFRGADGTINQGLIELLEAGKPSFIAIDEAHCISQWGHEFRPSYRVLGELRPHFPDCSLHAFTATATEAVREDIIASLNLRNCTTLIGRFDRPNLVYRAAYRKELLEQVEEVLKRHPDEGGIIYCIRKADVDSLCEKLRKLGYRALPYHAGLGDEERRRNQEAFIKEEVDIIVATVAFGMGIDRSNVRFVIHAGMPKSLENYQQEAGRAGRDGLEAECILFYSSADAMLWRRIQGENGSEYDKSAQNRLDGMQRFCQSFSCRHRLLADYFGETYESDNCGACDVCLGEQEIHPDSLRIARLLAECVKETRGRFGAPYLRDILKGARTAKIISNHHDELDSYASLQEASPPDIRDWFEQLIEQEFLTRETEFQVLRLSEKGLRLTQEDVEVSLTRPREKKQGTGKKSKSSHDPLFLALKELRKTLAQERNVPPYIILHDKALLEIAEMRPTTLDGLRKVKGIGEAKLASFGDRLLALLKDWGEPAATSASRKKGDSIKATLEYFNEGLSPSEIAQQRDLAETTIQNHLEALVLGGEIVIDSLVTPDKVMQVREAIAKLGIGASIGFLHLLLPESIRYEELRYVIADVRAKGNQPPLDPSEEAKRMRKLVQAGLDKNPGEVESVAEELKASSSSLRMMAALALGRIGTLTARETLERALDDEEDPTVASQIEKVLAIANKKTEEA